MTMHLNESLLFRVIENKQTDFNHHPKSGFQMNRFAILILFSAVLPLVYTEVAFAQCGNSLSCASSTCCNAGGPGTEMTKMINRLGLGSDCGRCKALAAEMDAKGPQWVRQNFECVVSRTVSNAKNLGHRMGPVRRAGVRSLVRRAIRKSSF